MDETAAPIRPGIAKGTRERILDTAELLFAREGPAAVTLRSIAAAAQVNIAAVNYHFGSKDKLFEEMFLRRLVPLNEARLAGLARCTGRAGGAPDLVAIIAAFVMPAIQLTRVASDSARAIVVQYSLGRVLAMPEVDTMLIRYYDRVRTEFVDALQRAAPHLTRQEVIWRYYWMGGSLMVSLAVPPGMVEPAGESPASARDLASGLIGFLAQGFGPTHFA